MSTSVAHEFHEVADAFPLMEGEDFDGLKADIQAHGLIEPIWLHDGKIIDGRNRYRACQELSIEPDFREWNGRGELVDFVASLNIHRRHLSVSQRAMAGAALKCHFEGEARRRQATSTGGTNPQLVADLPQAENGKSREKAAAAVGVSPRLIDAADSVRRNGVPELARAVESGKVKVSAAAEVAKLPEPEQRKVVAEGPTAIKARAAEARPEKAASRPDPESNGHAPLAGQGSFLEPRPSFRLNGEKSKPNPLGVALHDLFMVLGSVREHGGPLKFSRSLQGETPATICNQIDHIVETLIGWKQELSEARS
jgi:hypothetical protein